MKVGLYGVHNWMDLQDVSHSTMQGMLGLIFGLKSASFVTIQCLDEILKKRGGGGPCSCR